MKKMIGLLIASIMSVMVFLTAFAYNPSPGRTGGGGSGTSVISGVTLTCSDGSRVMMTKASSAKKALYIEQAVNTSIARGVPADKVITAEKTGVQLYEGKISGGLSYILAETPENEAASVLSDKGYNEMLAARKEITAAKERMDTYVPSVAQKAKDAGFAPEKCYVYSLEDWSFYQANPGYSVSTQFPGADVRVNMANIRSTFVCMLVRDNGVWKMMDTSWDGDYLIYHIPAGIGPIAIICAGDGSILESGSKQSPKTGDSTILWTVFGAGAALLLLGTVCISKSRKR